MSCSQTWIVPCPQDHCIYVVDNEQVTGDLLGIAVRDKNPLRFKSGHGMNGKVMPWPR
jgi:hypothetical protein